MSVCVSTRELVYQLVIHISICHIQISDKISLVTNFKKITPFSY